MLAAALLLAVADRPFPERVPGMVEDCVHAAVAAGAVSEDEERDSHKYICEGAPATLLWAWLEAAGISSWTQDVPEGRWLSRAFPLGACFKRIRDPDGSPPTPGLSCSIWVPRARPGGDHTSKRALPR